MYCYIYNPSPRVHSWCRYGDWYPFLYFNSIHLLTTLKPFTAYLSLNILKWFSNLKVLWKFEIWKAYLWLGLCRDRLHLWRLDNLHTGPPIELSVCALIYMYVYILWTIIYIHKIHLLASFRYGDLIPTFVLESNSLDDASNKPFTAHLPAWIFSQVSHKVFESILKGLNSKSLPPASLPRQAWPLAPWQPKHSTKNRLWFSFRLIWFSLRPMHA
jgi:hypothetical protein